VTCCEHCTCKTAQDLEDEAFERSKRAILEYRSPTDRVKRAMRNRRAIVDAIYAARPVINVTPVIMPPSPTDPYRPRG
jgi:hypothetical protein